MGWGLGACPSLAKPSCDQAAVRGSVRFLIVTANIVAHQESSFGRSV